MKSDEETQVSVGYRCPKKGISDFVLKAYFPLLQPISSFCCITISKIALLQ
jgi:hypothetical protein